MGRNTYKRSTHQPLSESLIADILQANPPSSQSKEDSKSSSVPLTPIPSLPTRFFDYDTTNPVEHLRSFVAFCRSAVATYEENLRLIEDYDAQTQDVLHKIELANDQNSANGFALYKLLREIRRARRCAKSEVDLLKPLYDYLAMHSDLTRQLSKVQGDCSQMQEVIKNRKYALKTKILL